MGFHEPGMLADRRLIMGDSLNAVLQGMASHPGIVMGQPVMRVDAQHLLKKFQRFTRTALVQQCRATGYPIVCPAGVLCSLHKRGISIEKKGKRDQPAIVISRTDEPE